mmetsp:Transcript_34807/g.98683  ORF Transcript_34807/g.98683 Transcript_34807/m.98683 type:complete len:610 (-) Transcript_34807:114-1943(-)
MASAVSDVLLPCGHNAACRARCSLRRHHHVRQLSTDQGRVTGLRLRKSGRVYYSHAALGDFDSLLASNHNESRNETEEIQPSQGAHHVYSQFGPEVIELCKLQLALASAGLCRGRPGTDHGFVVTVYGRCPHSFETGALELVQLASSGPAATGSSGRAAMEGLESDIGVIVLGATSPASTEASLVSQEWIILPSSNSIVMPLSWGPLLVGLVLVERAALPSRASGESPPGPQIADGGRLDLAFSPEDKEVLLNMARSITIACVMDQKVALLQAQAAMGREHMSGLVEDAKGPLAALNTIGSLLTPRLDEGEPEQDMAHAMLVQGQRLKEVVEQLQSALCPGPQAPQDSRAIASSSAPMLPYSPLADTLTRSGLNSSSCLPPRQIARSDSAEAGDQGRLSPVPSSFNSIRARTQEPPGGGESWCNAITVVMDLVNTSSGVCAATGVTIELGKGLQRYQQKAEKMGRDKHSATIVRPLLPLNVAVPPAVLRAALSQVLDSSFQRTPHGGKITLDAERCEDGNAYLWVSDSGEGLGSSITSSLNIGCLPPGGFKEQSASKAMSRIRSQKPAGLGLIGIKIASDMLGKEGGSVTVHAGVSGTVVCISLPLWLR